MYLNTESLNVELITSKSSEMNVMVPKANGDYVSFFFFFFSINLQICSRNFSQLYKYITLQSEYPVPEQFKTTINQNGLNTTAIDSLG